MSGYRMNASMTSEKRRLLKQHATNSVSSSYNSKYAKYIFIALAICFIGTVVLISRLDIANVIKNSLGVVTIAGCSSLIGGLSVFCINRHSPSIIPMALSFSAAILVHLAALTLIPSSMEEFEHGIHDHDDVLAHLYASISVICGILMTMFIEYYAKAYFDGDSDSDNDTTNEMVSYSKKRKMKKQNEQRQTFQRLTNFVVIVLILYHMAEGIATFVQLFEDYHDAALIAFALCLRVIPMGVCIAILTFVCSASKTFSFLFCFLCAIGYCLGGLIGWAMIENMEETSMDILIATIFGIIAGVILYVVFVQLVPNAIINAKGVVAHWSYIAFFCGLFVLEFANIVLKAVGFDEGHHHGHAH